MSRNNKSVTVIPNFPPRLLLRKCFLLIISQLFLVSYKNIVFFCGRFALLMILLIIVCICTDLQENYCAYSRNEMCGLQEAANTPRLNKTHDAYGQPPFNRTSLLWPAKNKGPYSVHNIREYRFKKRYYIGLIHFCFQKLVLIDMSIFRS